MNCPVCGNPMSEDADFCPLCNAKMGIKKESEKLPESDKFVDIILPSTAAFSPIQCIVQGWELVRSQFGVYITCGIIYTIVNLTMVKGAKFIEGAISRTW
jgi:hypothetical protein